jgi:hypothetical protein
MSDTKPLPDDPDRTAATAAATEHTAADADDVEPEPAPTYPAPGEPVWAAEPAAQPVAAAPAAAPGRVRAAGGRLGQSRVRVPLLVGAATLVLGCCLGAGVVAAGVAVFGHDRHGDDRGRITRDDRGPRGPIGRGDEQRGDPKRIRPGDGFRKQPSPPAPAATAPAPTPSAS